MKKIVCIGDSLTTGYGVFKEDSWINKLGQDSGLELINKGINGDTTAGMLSRSFKDVVNIKPDFVFIMGGTNDIMSNMSLKNTENCICELADEALKYNITPVIGIQPPIIGSMAYIHWSHDADYRKIKQQQIKYKNWIISQCRRQKIKYIDFFELFYFELKTTAPDELFIDGIHPSKKGHKLMEDLMISKFTETFNFKHA